MRIDYSLFEIPKVFITDGSEELVRSSLIAQTENDYFHNHIGCGFRYKYPLIQYKIINNSPALIGIKDCSSIIKKAFTALPYIEINKNIISCDEIKIIDFHHDFSFEKKLITYRYKTPYIGLNEKNFKNYVAMKSNKEKSVLLDSIITGNILSMLKGLDIRIENEIKVQSKLREGLTIFKSKKFLSFYGSFQSNIRIPTYFGLGKSVSRGFGMIEPIF